MTASSSIDYATLCGISHRRIYMICRRKQNVFLVFFLFFLTARNIMMNALRTTNVCSAGSEPNTHRPDQNVWFEWTVQIRGRAAAMISRDTNVLYVLCFCFIFSSVAKKGLEVYIYRGMCSYLANVD